MNKALKTVCKIGQGKECCRYLGVGVNGFECLKHTELKEHLDQRVATNTITAQGDNCGGLRNEELNIQE